MGLDLRMLKDLGRHHKFKHHWPDVDTSKWPGKELEWVFAHPAISVVILYTFVVCTVGLIASNS